MTGNHHQVYVLNPSESLFSEVRPEVADRIFHSLESGRRYFGSAGASLTHHANNPDFSTPFGRQVVRAGMEGERSTSRVIREWMEKYPGAVLIDSVHIKGMGRKDVDPDAAAQDGDGPDTDHVLIVGSSVFTIDSKRWKSRRKYSVSDKGVVLRSGRSFPGGRVHARQARGLWSKYLGKNVRVNSIVCVNNDKVFVQFQKGWPKHGFQLVGIDNLTRSLDYRMKNHLSENDLSTIDSGLVAKVAMCCIKPYDGYTKVFSNMDAIRNFK